MRCLKISGYRDAIHGRGLALNLVSLVGHAALRLAVMGHERRPPRTRNAKGCRRCWRANCAPARRACRWVWSIRPAPMPIAASFWRCAETVQENGKMLAAHIRSYEGELLDPWTSSSACSGHRRAGPAVAFAVGGAAQLGQMAGALNKLEQARGQGIDVSFDMYPYPAGSSYILQLLPTARAGRRL